MNRLLGHAMGWVEGRLDLHLPEMGVQLTPDSPND